MAPGTIRAVALASALPPERKKSQRERLKLGLALAFIDSILEADRKAPRKQQHTGHRIWMRLRQEIPEIVVGESTVREYACERKQATGLLKHQVFVAPLHSSALFYRPGTRMRSNAARAVGTICGRHSGMVHTAGLSSRGKMVRRR
jgi:hypothetical protein